MSEQLQRRTGIPREPFDFARTIPSPSGPGEILDLIRTGTAVTRGAIQRITSLSRVTVAQRIAMLTSSQLIRESGSKSTGGRRARTLEFNVDHSVILCATIDTRHARAAVARLDGEILMDRRLETSVSDGPESVLSAVDKAFSELLASMPAKRGQVGAVALSIPAPVDPKSRRPSRPPIMPGWDSYPIPDIFTEVYNVPTFVENDADAMAAGEQARNFAECSSLCLVKVSTGIGCGIVIDGGIYHGVDGGAGDIGHVRLPGVEAVCQCGSVGCLASIASGGALVSRLTSIGKHAESGHDVGLLVAAGDVPATTLVHEAGREIGGVLATLVSTLNPGVLLVAGDLASSALLSGIRETLYPRSLPRMTRNLEVKLSALGEDAGIIGLTHTVVERMYSAAQINMMYGSSN